MLPFSIPRDPPNPGIKPVSLAFPALAGRFFNTVPPGKPRSTSSAYRVDTHINHDAGDSGGVENTQCR